MADGILVGDIANEWCALNLTCDLSRARLIDVGDLDCDFLGQIPLDSNVRAGGDAGIPIVIAEPDTTTAFAFRSIASQVLGFLERNSVVSSH